MAVIAYDRYNVIVKGMSGTRMTTSNFILRPIQLRRLNDKVSIKTGKACILIGCCWMYAISWSILPYFGFGRFIPEGILDSCSFDYLTRDQSV